MLNCQSFMNLVTSNVDCQLINKFRFLVNSKQKYGCTEILCEFLITNHHNQFKHKSEMDPDEFIRFLIPFSTPLADICTIHLEETTTCDACPVVAKTYNTHIGLHLFLSSRDNTIKISLKTIWSALLQPYVQIAIIMQIDVKNNHSFSSQIFYL